MRYDIDSRLQAAAMQARAEFIAETIVGAFRLVRRAIVTPLANWYRRERLYEELNSLSDRMLADIGLSRADVARVARAAYGSKDEAAAPAIQVRPVQTPAFAVEASNDAERRSLAA